MRFSNLRACRNMQDHYIASPCIFRMVRDRHWPTRGIFIAWYFGPSKKSHKCGIFEWYFRAFLEGPWYSKNRPRIYPAHAKCVGFVVFSGILSKFKQIRGIFWKIYWFLEYIYARPVCFSQIDIWGSYFDVRTPHILYFSLILWQIWNYDSFELVVFLSSRGIFRKFCKKWVVFWEISTFTWYLDTTQIPLKVGGQPISAW